MNDEWRNKEGKRPGSLITLIAERKCKINP
jgi:hypothetical protein